jgi:uracil-DNA glycosylase family 4
MNKLINLNDKIIKCKKCPRLINFSKKISKLKRKQNLGEIYWGKPVPGFGYINSKILILGLAPAAHGGTRTGRAFTGDKSGDFLFKCLYKANLSNQPISKSLDDGLKLKSIFVTNILKCVPPEDKPRLKELRNCSTYFDTELENLKKLKLIITLGKVSFDNCIKYFKKKFLIENNKKFKFLHGKVFRITNKIRILSSYHPSPRNVNTGLINEKMMFEIFNKAKKLL